MDEEEEDEKDDDDDLFKDEEDEVILLTGKCKCIPLFIIIIIIHFLNTSPVDEPSIPPSELSQELIPGTCSSASPRQLIMLC